jgi:hypothetical protein
MIFHWKKNEKKAKAKSLWVNTLFLLREVQSSNLSDVKMDFHPMMMD